MAIDEKALETAIYAGEDWYEQNLSMAHKNRAEHRYEMIKAAIEAYEAERWRPIHEVPRDGTTVLIAHRIDSEWAYNVANHLTIGGIKLGVGPAWESSLEALEGVGAMFRTIDPPPQDAVSRATSTPPAAEEG